jgi:HTH-type transcriptional regulator/antitoxin HipB
MNLSSEQVGRHVRSLRKRLGITQERLAMVSGTGIRFIRDLESGKETCQIGKVLTVLQTLGVEITLVDPGVG